jgi:hypothetical protein
VSYYYYYYYYYYYKFYLFSVFRMIRKRTKVFNVYIVAEVLCLQYVVNVMLFPMMNILYCNIRSFRTVCSVSTVVVFCSSLESCFTGYGRDIF